MSSRIWGLVLAAIGALFVADGWRITQASRGNAIFDDLGPDRYLMLIGGLLTLMGLLVACERQRGEAAGQPEQQESAALPLLFTLLLATYAVVMTVLGYTVATLLFFFTAYWLAGRRELLKTALASIISAAAFYVIFPKLADMPLPTGLLGL